MKVSQIPAVIAAFAGTGRVAGFFGAPGMGKTALVHEGAKRIGQDVCVHELHLASLSEVDIRGYLIPDGDHSRFTAPPFWDAVTSCPHGILFLDEFPQAPPEVQKAVAPLLLDHRIGEYELPEGWMVVVAGNRLEDNAGANSILSHVLNRISYMEVEPDVEAWIAWAAQANVDPLAIAFATLRSVSMFDPRPPAADTPWATPRSVHALSDVSKSYPDGLVGMLGDEVGREIAAGFIGTGARQEFVALRAMLESLPDFEAIIANPKKIALPDDPEKKYVAMTMCAMRADRENMDKIVDWMLRFDANFTLIGVVMLVNRLPAAAKLLSKWISDNARLLGEFRPYL